MIRNRIGAATAADPGCPWYNPFCWFVPADDPNACYGGGPNIDVAACVAANNAAAAANARANPAGAQDYTDAATGNVVDLVNPFTGTAPAWLLPAAIGAGALLLIGAMKR